MLNILRLWCVILIDIIIPLASTSPNTENEMGSYVGDHIEKNGHVKGFYMKFVMTLSLFGISSGFHLMSHIQDALTFYDWVFMIVIISGFVLRMWSYYQLGHYFTFTLGIRGNHKIITAGPYRYLIHPSYTGQLMVIFGSALFLNMYHIGIVMLGYSFYVTRKRILIEENMMEKRFGHEYKKYNHDRYRLIPFVY